MENPKFDYEKPVFFLVEKKTDFLRNMFVDKYEKDKYENRANIGFPGKYVLTKIMYGWNNFMTIFNLEVKCD